jgi:hypothetical protein
MENISEKTESNTIQSFELQKYHQMTKEEKTKYKKSLIVELSQLNHELRKLELEIIDLERCKTIFQQKRKKRTQTENNSTKDEIVFFENVEDADEWLQRFNEHALER